MKLGLGGGEGGPRPALEDLKNLTSSSSSSSSDNEDEDVERRKKHEHSPEQERKLKGSSERFPDAAVKTAIMSTDEQEAEAEGEMDETKARKAKPSKSRAKKKGSEKDDEDFVPPPSRGKASKGVGAKLPLNKADKQ